MTLARRKPLTANYPTDPTKLLKHLGLFHAPVDVHVVAHRLGIETGEAKLDDRYSAFLVVKNTKPRIFVNERHHPHRQRFSVAHEIGHFLLHHLPSAQADGLYLDEKLDLYYRKTAPLEDVVSFSMERQANRFAAELLMPKQLLESYIDEEGLDVLEEKDMRKLATAFKVSDQALLIRMLEIGAVTASV